MNKSRPLLLVFFLFTLLVLAGCEPNEMNQAESDAIKACIEKGWIPKYDISGSHRNFKCTPQQ